MERKQTLPGRPRPQGLGMCCVHYAALRGRELLCDPLPHGVDDGPAGGAKAASMLAVLCDAGAQVCAAGAGRACSVAGEGPCVLPALRCAVPPAPTCSAEAASMLATRWNPLGPTPPNPRRTCRST